MGRSFLALFQRFIGQFVFQAALGSYRYGKLRRSRSRISAWLLHFADSTQTSSPICIERAPIRTRTMNWWKYRARTENDMLNGFFPSVGLTFRMQYAGSCSAALACTRERKWCEPRRTFTVIPLRKSKSTLMISYQVTLFCVLAAGPLPPTACLR